MRILHLLSQVEVTGAEVYTAALANMQISQGHLVWLMSDTLQTSNQADYISVKLHQRTFHHRIRNVKFIRQFINENKIDIVHAHSRASSWVGFFSVLGTKTPLISSIHGNQKFSFSKKIWNFYGDRLLPICQNLGQQLLSENFNIKIPKTIISPNGFTFSELKNNPPLNPVLVIAGRTTGLKGKIIGNIILEILPDLLIKYPSLKIQIIGGLSSNFSYAVQQKLIDFQQNYASRIEYLGFVTNLAEYLANATGVIASGRIAIEALSMGTPVCALGEASCDGTASEENIDNLINSNFGDIGTHYHRAPIDLFEVSKQIEILLTQTSVSTILIKKIREHYDLNRVYQQVNTIYRSAILEKHQKKHIPILMYHKVLEQAENSQHKTYVTHKQFYKHMNSLSKRHYTPINFKDYLNFLNGSRPLSEFPRKPIIITFDDAYVNNLHYALPILQKFQFTAVLYALGNSEARVNYWDSHHGEPEHPLMSPEQIQIMHEAGIEIGAHSMSHADLTKLAPEAAYQEIFESKKVLEALLGVPVISFAYPYGHYNETIKKLTSQAEFDFAVATDTGGLRIEDDHFAIFRVNIMPRDRGFAFWKKIQPWYRDRYFKKRGK